MVSIVLFANDGANFPGQQFETPTQKTKKKPLHIQIPVVYL